MLEKTPHPFHGEESCNSYGYSKNFRTALPQIIAVSIKNLLLVGYGMTLGFPTILIPAVSNPVESEVVKLDKSEISWIGSINLIVVPLGCALSGVVTTPLGRRLAMQLVNIPFIAAWILFHFARSPIHLYAALVLTGFAGGLLEAPVLTYVAEITQPHLRGALTATSSMCIIFGVFTQFLFGTLLYWRTVTLVNIAFTILSTITLCFIPESPHWLVSKQRIEDAKKSLQWLRGWTNEECVQPELNDIKALFERKEGETGKSQEAMLERLACYRSKSFLRPYFLVCASFFIGHFSGMTTLQTYAVMIFQMLEAPIDKYYATLILGIVQMVGSFICVVLVHYTGKRPLTLFSTIGAAICCILTALYDGYIKFNGIPELASENSNGTMLGSDTVIKHNPYSWVPTALLLLLALITHTGIRLLPWILIGEVFSARTRSTGAGLSSAIGYIFSFLTNKTFILMVNSLSIWGTYGFYGFVCTAGTIMLYFILPETEGKKLNEIENHFAGVKRLTNAVYRSKKTPDKTRIATIPIISEITKI